MDSKKIRVAITHGDTNGIGYELIFKAFSEPEMLEYCTPIIYGSPKVAAYYRKAMNLPAQFSIIQKAEDAEDGRINLLPAVDEEVKVDMGMPTQESGTAAIKALDRAMTDYRDELFDVLITAPVNNQNAQFEGFQFKGHKEYIETCLGEGAKGLSILCGGDLRIASVTGKTPLKDVPAAITQELIIEKVKQMHTSLKRDFMITNPPCRARPRHTRHPLEKTVETCCARQRIASAKLKVAADRPRVPAAELEANLEQIGKRQNRGQLQENLRRRHDVLPLPYPVNALLLFCRRADNATF